MSLLADIYLKTNDWANATHAADIVLERGKSHNKARLVKAEALFNVCQFEHAMVHFHRGMVSTRTVVCPIPVIPRKVPGKDRAGQDLKILKVPGPGLEKSKDFFQRSLSLFPPFFMSDIFT